MRYSLRTLLLVLAVGPLLIAGAWSYANALSGLENDLLAVWIGCCSIVAVCLGFWIISGIATQRQY